MRTATVFLLRAGAFALLAFYGWNMLVESIDTRTGVHFDGFGRVLSQSLLSDWRTPPLAEMWIEVVIWSALLGLMALASWAGRQRS